MTDSRSAFLDRALPAVKNRIVHALYSNIWLSYGFLVACGVFMRSASGVFWTISPMLFPSEVVGGARGIINALGNPGGFIGPFVVGWLRTAFHSYGVGVYFLTGMLIAGFLLALSLPRCTTAPSKRMCDVEK
jgi:nitrate/nitrite transporter NarK